jgi:hypothetical protein
MFFPARLAGRILPLGGYMDPVPRIQVDKLHGKNRKPKFNYEAKHHGIIN